MKKIALPISVIVVVGALAFLLATRLEPGADAPEIGRSLLRKAPKDTVLLFAIRPEAIHDSFQTVNDLRIQLEQTTLGQRYGLGDKISSLWKSFEQNPSSTPAVKNFSTSADLLLDAWRNLQEGIAFTYTRTFQIGDDPVPVVHVAFEFLNEHFPNLIHSYIDDHYLKGSKEFQQGKLSIQRLNGEEYLLQYDGETPESKSLGISLKIRGELVEAKLAAADVLAFIPEEPAQQLLETSEWKQAVHDFRPDYSAVWYSALQNGMEYLQRSFPNLFEDPKLKDIFLDDKSPFAMIRHTESLAHQLYVKDGLRIHSCTMLKENAPILATVNTMIETAAGGISSATPRTSALINKRTIFSFHTLGAGITSLLEQMNASSLFADAVFKPEPAAQDADTSGATTQSEGDPVGSSAAGGTDPRLLSDEEFRKIAVLVEGLLTKLNFRHIGLVLNAPAIGPLPEFALLFADGTLSADESLGEFENFFLDPALAKIEGLTVEKGEDSHGQRALLISAGPTLKTALVQAGERSLLYSLNILMASALERKATAADRSEFEQLAAGLRMKPESLVSYSTSSTRALIQALKPYIGMLLMFGGDKLKITQNEVEELLTLFEYDLLTTVTMEKTGERAYCASTRYRSVHYPN